MYRSALIFITGDRYNIHRRVLYGKVGWSSLAARRLLFICKALTGYTPSYITEMLSVNNAICQTRSSDWISFQVPRASTELGKSFFFSCSTSEMEFITGNSKALLAGVTSTF